MEVWNPHEGEDELSPSPDRKGKRIITDPDWTPSESDGGESSESDGGEPSESDGGEPSESDVGEDQQHSTEMKPKLRRKRATKVESDDSAQPPPVRRRTRVGESAPTTLPRRCRRLTDPNVVYLEDPEEEDTESPDLPGEENFLNVTEFSLNHESHELAASPSMEYSLMKSSYPRPEQMESPHHLPQPMESLHHRFQPMESLHDHRFQPMESLHLHYCSKPIESSHHLLEPMGSSLHLLEPMGSSHHLLKPMDSLHHLLKPMESSLHLLEPPMGSSHHNRDYDDNTVDKNLSFLSEDELVGIMGKIQPPLCTSANYESDIVFGHTFSPPIPKEQRMIPLGLLNPLFDIPKEHPICKHPPLLEEENHKRTPLGPLNPNYLQARVHRHNLQGSPQQLSARATMMAIIGAQQQQSVASPIATHQRALGGATFGAPQQVAAIAVQATTKKDTYCQFDVTEGGGELKFSCLLPGCLGNGIHPTTRTAFKCHRRDYHPDMSPSLPRQSSIAKWLSLGKPRPYIHKAICPRKSSHSKAGVHGQKQQEISKGPLGPKMKPLLPKVCSLESLPSPVLINSSMVARTSPDSLEDPLVSPTSLATLGGQVVAATGPTSFKGPVLSATTLDTLEDHVVLVATTPSSFEVTNPPSFDVPKVASPSPDSIGDSATQPSLEGLQVEAFGLGQGVDGDHKKETNTSHMMAQELSDGQVDSNQAAPKASAPDALMLFLEDLDHEENELCMYTPSSGEQEKDEQSISSEQAMKEFDSALFDF